jgi:hypothetical protein
MITFLRLGKHGRFGNQLFQYAALRALGLKINCEIGLLTLKNTSYHNQENLLQNLSIPDVFFGRAKFYHHFTQKRFIENNLHKISSKFYTLKDKTDIFGHFQSIYYFKDSVDLVKKELTPKHKYIQDAKNKIEKIKSKFPKHQIVSLHLRRGDTVDIRFTKKFIDHYGGDVLDKKSFYGKYLFKSKSIFKNKKIKFLVFSGGARTDNKYEEDINWCRKNLIGEEYLFCEPQKTLEDFSLIKECDHNIISHASTFGWWAAFLNGKKNSIVVAPKIYDPENPKFQRFMFYPKEWIII